VARLQAGASLAVSNGAIAGIVGGLLAVAAPLVLRRVVYKTRTAAVLAQCALLGAILVPAAALLTTAAPAVPAPAALPHGDSR
jgi:hypothetical protein